ncbi:hypothetical protein, partial [Klebsiella pneumoniae]|uniref:hypothetical protein n=1 Tax=Klebsiella pneumoniae TaxID=573 RepID=UPI003A800BA3
TVGENGGKNTEKRCFLPFRRGPFLGGILPLGRLERGLKMGSRGTSIFGRFLLKNVKKHSFFHFFVTFWTLFSLFGHFLDTFGHFLDRKSTKWGG